MKKPQIKLEELAEDIDKVLNLIQEIDNLDPESKNKDKIYQKIHKTNKEIKNKYKDLDTQK
jgi:hypothetical protein